MFQMATVIGTAFKHGYDYALPNNTENSFEWPKHPFKVPELTNFNIRNELNQYYEPSHSYNEIKEDNICLNGYFQSEKYFSHCRGIILYYFGAHKPLVDYVSVHVRRGDYLKYPTKHPIPSLNYYKGAFGLFPEGTVFMVFSDDIAWCKENINFSNNILFSESKSEIEDLHLMSRCKHHIIANSSFSWWGAWLCTNPNKIIVRPSVWFGVDNSHLDDKDICPKNWIIYEST
jgi:hypothetical protein